MDLQTENPGAEGTLKQAGLQKTAQRLAVLDVFARAEHPLTASDVFERLSLGQKVNRVTVYRILTSYTSKGIIREFESKRGIHFYERIEPGGLPLPHFNCRACGVMICMTASPPLGSWEKMVNEPGFEIENISLSGLCRQCKTIKERRKRR